MPGGGELAHVQPKFGDEHLGGLGADAGDLVQALQRRQRGRVGGGSKGLVGVLGAGGGRRSACARSSGAVPGGWAAGMAPISSWMRLVSRSIWMPSASMWSSSILASSAWWSSKRPVSAATNAARLPRIRPLASSASTLGSRCPAISAASMARPETPMMSVATVPSLIRASSSSLLQPLHLPAALGGQVGPQPGGVPQLADLGRWDKRRPQHAPLVEPGQPHRIQLVGLGPARQVLGRHGR
jgi:hypothetical protein